MIIQPARIVIIDDNEEHLNTLSSALTSLGSASLAFRYEDAHPTKEHMHGARVIFCDLHLSSGAMTTDTAEQCANIASMLAQSLDEDHGPYLLVIWSEHSDKIEPLTEYLNDLAPGQRPLIVQTLDKKTFLDLEADKELDNSGLDDAVAGILKAFPALSVMLRWEQLVALAAAKTTSRLWTLANATAPDNTDAVLKEILGMLVRGASGKQEDETHVGANLVEALEPLLSDRVTSANTEPDDAWASGVELNFKKSKVRAASLYGSVHIESPTKFPPIKRGVVSNIEDYIDPKKFEDEIGFSANDLMVEFGIAPENTQKVHDRARWCLLHVNAACDEAQANPGLLPFCLGLLLPKELWNNGVSKRMKDSVKHTREFDYQDRDKSDEIKEHILLLHGRFIFGLTKTQAENLTAMFRIRTNLLDKLIFQLRTHAARPGVIEPF